MACNELFAIGNIYTVKDTKDLETEFGDGVRSRQVRILSSGTQWKPFEAKQRYQEKESGFYLDHTFRLLLPIHTYIKDYYRCAPKPNDDVVEYDTEEQAQQVNNKYSGEEYNCYKTEVGKNEGWIVAAYKVENNECVFTKEVYPIGDCFDSEKTGKYKNFGKKCEQELKNSKNTPPDPDEISYYEVDDDKYEESQTETGVYIITDNDIKKEYTEYDDGGKVYVNSQGQVLTKKGGEKVIKDCDSGYSVSINTYYPTLECKETNPDGTCVEVFLNGRLNTVYHKLYAQCFVYNPKDPKDSEDTGGGKLTLLREFQYNYQWDIDAPLCISTAVGEKDTCDDNYANTCGRDECYRKQFQKLKEEGRLSSIYFKDNQGKKTSWDGKWTNKDLYFTYQCFDRHSGCKDKTLTDYLRPLRNRQDKTDIPGGIGYEDKVNNKMSPNEQCSITFQKLEGYKATRSRNKTTGEIDKCKYKPVFTKCDISKKDAVACNPIIDKTAPIVKITPGESTEDNPGKYKTMKGKDWSFYAGKINFTVDIRDIQGDKNKDPIGWGVSGLKDFNIRLVELNDDGSIKRQINGKEDIYNPNSEFKEEIERRNDANLDYEASTIPRLVSKDLQIDENGNKVKLDDSLNLLNSNDGTISWDVTLLKKGKYKIIAQASDYAGNTGSVSDGNSTFTNKEGKQIGAYEFTVVENFNKNKGQFKIVEDENWLNACHNARTTKTLPSGCEPKDSNIGGYIKIVSKNLPDLYADAKTTRDITFQFYDKYFNELDKKKFKSLDFKKSSDPKNTEKCIKLDQVDKSKTCKDNNALVSRLTHNGLTDNDFRNPPLNFAGQTNSQGQVRLQIFSYAPGKLPSTTYEGKLCYWDNFGKSNCKQNLEEDYDLAGPLEEITGDVYHIFTGAIVIGEEGKDQQINIPAENKIALQFKATQSSDNILPTTVQKAFQVNDFIETLSPDENNKNRTEITCKKDEDKIMCDDYKKIVSVSNLKGLKNNSIFKLEQTEKVDKFTNTDKEEDRLLGVVSKPWVEIKLQGDDVTSPKPAKYYIAKTEDDYEGGLKKAEGTLDRIYIKGYKQTRGKERYTTNQVNIFSGKYSPAKLRDLVYKNVALLTRNRQPAKDINKANIVKGVLFMEGDQTLSKLGDKWHTLIIKDGNLTIDENFNVNNTEKSIVVLSDDPVHKPKPNEWGNGNILIKPDVEYIAANIYADTSIISVNKSGKSFEKSDYTRTQALQKQIVFYGSIFSQNTIGGAVKGEKGETVYYRPYLFNEPSKPAEPDNLFWALEYDLSFLRMNSKNNDFDKQLLKGDERDEPVVIIYNPKIVENPNIVEQFQVVVNGWEIIKAYSELVDPKIQKDNFDAQTDALERGDEEATSGDDDFVLAMEYAMPPQSGWGMGIERVFSLLTGQENLRDVVLFPLMRSEKKGEEK
ncbi:hypothetical protein KGV55_02675 [Candidatus Gracilibacteria bacterium]|nr:hypothetical protein [Candidatus Gracilibacteria bacterium]